MRPLRRSMKISQYSIVLVELAKSGGAEIASTRPCVVVLLDEMNRYLRTVVVAPMTTRVDCGGSDDYHRPQKNFSISWKIKPSGNQKTYVD